MNDGLLFLFGIIFFFILWVVSGGPTKPISFAGPFITPITNIGQTQIGYGPKLPSSESISATGGSITPGTKISTGDAGSSTVVPSSQTRTSPYAGAIRLDHFISEVGEPNPTEEYLSLHASSGNAAGIDISGWEILSEATGVRVIIPEGVPVLNLGTVTLQPILLGPGDLATVSTGFSPVTVSYEENTCTNYILNQPQYAGCFADHVGYPGFLTGTWRIYLNRSSQLWKDHGDTIELFDQDGRLVDSFSY